MLVLGNCVWCPYSISTHSATELNLQSLELSLDSSDLSHPVAVPWAPHPPCSLEWQKPPGRPVLALRPSGQGWPGNTISSFFHFLRQALTVRLCSLGWPEPCCVDQAGLTYRVCIPCWNYSVHHSLLISAPCVSEHTCFSQHSYLPTSCISNSGYLLVLQQALPPVLSQP